MTREQAMRQAVKRWGKSAIIRADQSISSPEKRETATAVVREARRRLEAIEQEIAARLSATDWYQTLTAEKREQRAIIHAHEGEMSYHKFAVGKDLGYAFLVQGSGDTWEEAFANADSKAKAS